MRTVHSFHTGEIVTVDVHDVPAWAFCERAFLSFADPKAVIQATLYPSQFNVEYHKGSGQRKAAAPVPGLVDTRPVLGLKTQTIKNGGFIQIFRKRMPFVITRADGKEMDKADLEERVMLGCLCRIFLNSVSLSLSLSLSLVMC